MPENTNFNQNQQPSANPQYWGSQQQAASAPGAQTPAQASPYRAPAAQPAAAQPSATQSSAGATQPSAAYPGAAAAQSSTAQPASAYQQAPGAAAHVTQGSAAAQTQRFRTSTATATSPYAATSPAYSSAQVAAKAKSGGGFKTFLFGFLGAALAFALGSGILFGLGAGARTTDGQQAATTTGSTTVIGAPVSTTIDAAAADMTLAEAVAEKALPSIVAIDTYASASNYGGWWGSGSGGASNSLMAVGLGSGVLISDDGYVLTNYHVVEGADKLMLTAGGQEYEGTVVGTDPSSDLAVVKIDATGLTPVEIGSSSELRPGQWVMALGSPFGLEQSVSVGIVSAVSRTVVIGSSSYSYGSQSSATDVYANMIQTDAAINPGNSGGALVDQNGKLVGINSVIESYSGSSSGVGFAIPVDYAMNIASQIIEGKTPTHAQLGVATTTIDSEMADRYNLGVSKGAYISRLYDNSGASEAGLETGDIITKVDDTAIESSTDLVAAIRSQNVGDTVTIEFVRGTETRTVEVTLGSDEEVVVNATTPSTNEDYMQDLMELFGGGNGGNGNNGSGGNGFGYEDLRDLLRRYYGQ